MSDSDCVKTDTKESAEHCIINPFCALFLTKKKRNCKMRVKLGAIYCAEHLITSEHADSEDKRVPCPLDPAHSVYESRLEAHLKKCNARTPEIIPNYFSNDMNINVDALMSTGNSSDDNYVANRKKPTVSELVERILKVSEAVLADHPIYQRRFQEEKTGISESEKHRLQQDTLSQLILAKTAGYEKVVVLEFGAGKGGLSNFLWESHFGKKDSTGIESEFILIDRSNSRCKKDAKMKHEGAKVKRIFIDIKDLNLECLLAEYDKERTYFLWVSKHLCGAATCLTINSLVNMKEKVKGTFCVALCCHQCCSWPAYPNKMFLKDSGLIKEGEDEEKVFKMMCSITSWAVCGFRSDYESEDETFKRVKLADVLDESEIYSDEKKATAGRLMKRLFDHGRELKLKELLVCELKHYIEEEVTLENAVLIGHTQTEKVK